MKDRIHPLHVSIIMDGNGRWAKERKLNRNDGHKAGIQAVRNSIESAIENNISYLSLYAFSEENWNRPQSEIENLMSLMLGCISSECESLMKNGVKFVVLGNLSRLPEMLKKSISELENLTKNNTRLTLIIFLSYSGRWDITNAIKNIVNDYTSGCLKGREIDQELVENYLVTHKLPDPDLIIRTSGEQRISNFLLWQCAYSEFVFLDINWPDFSKDDFRSALDIYYKRDRRFGKIE